MDTKCKQCGKETWNETSDFSGFCSEECEEEYLSEGEEE